MVKKKKVPSTAPVPAAVAQKVARRTARLEPKHARTAKKEHRKRDRKTYTADMWAIPAPSHLVARLEIPKPKSKYHSYFEFAENTERKKKKLEFKVTDDSKPPPGFRFVPIGDPTLTNACKELSRERDAMIFIVSGSKEENSKISEHIYRTGYHFRESIVDEARGMVGESTISTGANGSREAEPIPESQDEINKQADGAIRDLFPRIPHTDRQMIIEHAFKKGAMFHGEPTVGLQPGIPLSRRVQLAVLAHIRHTHTRYDQLLRETSWMNARKAVEPVCLDVLVKWRGDEETGRDQMDEILREVVIITDSEATDESSDEKDSSEEEGEITSSSSTGLSQPNSRNQSRSAPSQPVPKLGGQFHQTQSNPAQMSATTNSTRGLAISNSIPMGEKKAQRGFRRYQAAWDEAVNRRHAQGSPAVGTPIEDPVARKCHQDVVSPIVETNQYFTQPSSASQCGFYGKHNSTNVMRPDSFHLRHQQAGFGRFADKIEVMPRPLTERFAYSHNSLPIAGIPSYSVEDTRPSVVSRASQSSGLQDFLVPSIETGSSDALSPRPELRRERMVQEESYPRRVVEKRRQSPPHEFIVIHDDSPQTKRRRVAYEAGCGHLRPMASDSTVHPDSFSVSAPSVQPKDSFGRSPRLVSRSDQGLFTDRQTGNSIPVYDAPADSNYFATHSSYPRRTAMSSSHLQAIPRIRQIDSPSTSSDHLLDSYIRRPVTENMRMVERVRPTNPGFSYTDQILRPISPAFPVSDRVSRSYEMDSDRVYSDQAFINTFSQSRLEPTLSKRRDALSTPSERSHYSLAGHGRFAEEFENHSSRSLTTVRHGPARSPVNFVERPMYCQGGLSQPILHDHVQPLTLRPGYAAAPQTFSTEQPPLQSREDLPFYVKTTPRREFITLD